MMSDQCGGKMKAPANDLMVKRYRTTIMGKTAWRMILLLTTTGRKTGNPHTVVVQYEKIDDKYYIGASRGKKCDWYRNILANPNVIIEIGDKKRYGIAEAITGEDQIADFLEYRLHKHPLMVGLILRADGCSFHPDRAQLLEYARGIGLVSIRVTGE
jgi:deazaflavin-dependent oxidoreductase (nitroreductase family)